jgi:hypothetical protein
VWASTDPRKYIVRRLEARADDIGAAQKDSLLTRALNNIGPQDRRNCGYDNRFTQMRVDGYARGAMWVGTTAYANYYNSKLRIDPDCLITRSAVSTIMGFSLKDSVKQALAAYYSSVPFVVPSERIFIQSFSTGPSASGLNCAMNIPLINAKEVIALFPRSPNDLT